MTTLQPPGNGLPAFERVVLGTALKIGSALMSDDRLLAMFAREASTILTIVDEADYDRASQQVLIPRLSGIEDSSRNWSLFMVLDHLCQVNRDILRTIDRLKDGIVPGGEVNIASYKPDPDCGAEMVDRFRDDVWDFDGEIRQRLPLRGTPRFDHPWFGPLDAHSWLSLAAVHQRIHRKQARKIITLLGQT